MEDLVQPAGAPADVLCDHRLSPLEAMAKAYVDDLAGGVPPRWEDFDEERAGCIDAMRAALLTLAECDLPEMMEIEDGRLRTRLFNFDKHFPLVLRSIASSTRLDEKRSADEAPLCKTVE